MRGVRAELTLDEEMTDGAVMLRRKRLIRPATIGGSTDLAVFLARERM